MRILIGHSAYLSGAASGENRVVEDEARLLREAGHEIRVWERSPSGGAVGAIRAGFDAVWSPRATAELRRMVDEVQPDVIHLHNLFPSVSPAALRIGGVPVVVTLHNYRFLCLPSTFLRDGRVCEDCLGRGTWRGVVHRCYRGSAAASASLAVSLTVHRAAGTFERPRLWFAVSEFVRSKYLEAGWDGERIAVKPNFAWPTERRQGPGGPFVYVGRLSPEKGVAELLRAWRGVRSPLVIVGDGPQREELEALAPAGVEFRGAVPHADVGPIVHSARAILVPSTCYEGQPRAVLESYAAGVPVIANATGGLLELVTEGETGVLVQPGDDPGWAAAACHLEDDEVSERLGLGAFEHWKRRYSPAVALENAEAAYARAATA